MSQIASRDDTITAISTPHGRGGIGVIRLSGPRALEIVLEIFRRKNEKDGNELRCASFDSHHAYYGVVADPLGHKIDEAVMTFMRGPRSYTCEDMVELSLHGSPVVLERVLALLVGEGARLALPGEFTKRAYLNKRMDLVQAEAVCELINAKSLLEARFVMKRVSGELSNFLVGIKDDILKLLTEFEAEIDFPEENLELESYKSRENLFSKVETGLGKLKKSYDKSSVFSGIDVAIVGVTNVGKSTLFNALLKRDRAIVSNIPGTTRDYLSDEIELGGLLFRFHDTAGLNFTSRDGIEREGIAKTFEIIDKSDLLLIVLEKDRPLSKEEKNIIGKANGKERIVVLNKSDLPGKSRMEGAGHSDILADILSDTLEISALKGTNLDSLKKMMLERFEARVGDYREAFVISSLRQKAKAEEALRRLSLARDSFKDKASPEFIAFDLKDAYKNLCEFVGEGSVNIDERVLDRIFSSFCIGK